MCGCTEKMLSLGGSPARARRARGRDGDRAGCGSALELRAPTGPRGAAGTAPRTVDVAAVEQLARDQAGLDGLADADVVCDQQAHRIELERHQQRHELIGARLDARSGRSRGRARRRGEATGGARRAGAAPHRGRHSARRSAAGSTRRATRLGLERQVNEASGPPRNRETGRTRSSLRVAAGEDDPLAAARADERPGAIRDIAVIGAHPRPENCAGCTTAAARPSARCTNAQLRSPRSPDHGREVG